MTLLTTEEYKAIAKGLSFPTQAFIDGGLRPALSGQTFETLNPATGAVLARVAACDAADVDFAVSKARDAFEDGRWSRLHPRDRKEVLIRLAKLIKRNARELAVMESLDSGKTIHDCATVDLPETIHCLTWHAELIDKIYDQVAPASDNHIAMIVREPVGVVGLVLPWNFPLLMLAWKIGPALAAGCSVIVKPAQETSLTALRVAESNMKEITLEMGGKAEKGFVEPTILEVSRDAKQAREETFGPVLTVLTVDSFDEAIALSNDTDYGLAASIFTANVKRAIRGARAIRAGTVTVNSFGEGDDSTPFGGFKQSVFGGRDNGIHAHDQYTQLKTIWVDLADDADEAVA